MRRVQNVQICPNMSYRSPTLGPALGLFIGHDKAFRELNNLYIK